MGRCLVLELLELLLGAGSLADLQHVEEHSLVQGLTLTHWNSVTSLEVPEVGHWCQTRSCGISHSSCTLGCNGSSLGG